ncbi:MAG: DUF6510 family protein [Chloroflexota bacterium]|nr:DUF6510 family protein [Chloroflexota bacterium]
MASNGYVARWRYVAESAPGIVLRCSVCDGVQLRIARTPRGYRYDARVRIEGRFPASG